MPTLSLTFSHLLNTLLLLSLLPIKLLSFLLPHKSNQPPNPQIEIKIKNKNKNKIKVEIDIDIDIEPHHHPQQSSSRMDPAELKRVFQMFDRNGDGRITKKELSHSLENLGIYIPDGELETMIDKIDVNHDGCVDIDEFGELYQTIMDEKDEEEDMREAFNVFDQNGDGFITVEELRSVLASLGLKQGRTVEDCRQMIRKVDENGDGMVNFKEFKRMMRGGGFAALT